MVTSQEIRSVQFEKGLRGYRTDVVDNFLDKVQDQVERDAAEKEELKKQIGDLQAELSALRASLKNYEEDGEMLKSALINAQRMGENVIREANQKSDEILHRANIRAEDIIRDANDLLQRANDRAEELVNEAQDRVKMEEREYERIRTEVTRFKSDVLNLYRSHVESLSRLPEYQKAAPAPAAEPAGQAAQAQPAPQPEQQEEQQPADEAFWEQDESQLKLDPAVLEEAAQAAQQGAGAFQGVHFSE